MVFDWFTFIAQIINFLILVYLLWRFLYKPITKTMGKRKEELEERWQKAQAEKEEAQAEAESYRQKKQDLEQREAEILAEAEEKAEEERKARLRKAREEINQKQAEWYQGIQRQQDSFLSQLRERIQQETFSVSRRALQDLANKEIEEGAIALFLQRLQTLDDQPRESLVQSAQDSPEAILIRSSFEIPEDQQQKIKHSLQETGIKEEKAVNYQIANELICGIELQVAHQKISWNLKDYLDNLESRFSDVFQAEQKQESIELKESKSKSPSSSEQEENHEVASDKSEHPPELPPELQDFREKGES